MSNRSNQKDFQIKNLVKKLSTKLNKDGYREYESI